MKDICVVNDDDDDDEVSRCETRCFMVFGGETKLITRRGLCCVVSPTTP